MEQLFYGIDVKTFLQRIDSVLKRGDRVELIPIKDGIKIIRVKREEIKDVKP